jgi:hypothetical protein
MPPWSRASVAHYQNLDLRAHALLADVPVHDVWRVFLPGEHRRCTMEEVRAVFRAATIEQTLGPPVRALFVLRRILGRLLRWDDPPPRPDTWSFQARLTERDRRESLVKPGTRDGPFTVLYVHTTEAVSELRNATVHGFLVWAVEPAPGGHQLVWAIHVRPVSAWTGPYLALIEPFRRWIVYPSLLHRFHDVWCGMGTVPEPSGRGSPGDTIGD